MKSNQSLVYIFILFMASVMIFGCKSSKKAASATTEPTREVKEEPAAVEKPAVETSKPTEVERTVEQKLEGYFDEIAGARDVNLANRNISEALTYFASKDAPVFIVFYREGGQKDYDKPTDIVKYLKDQKKNPYKIDKVIYDNQGKIEELELTTR
jgi:hypothetical protein